LYKNKNKKTNIQTNKNLTTNLEFIVIVSTIEPTIKKHKNTKEESGDKLIFNEVCDKEVTL
jgi:hypothetical protein